MSSTFSLNEDRSALMRAWRSFLIYYLSLLILACVSECFSATVAFKLFISLVLTLSSFTFCSSVSGSNSVGMFPHR